MNNYVTGAVIRRLREARRLTQEELAARIHVSGKAVSKWETGQGFPDVSLLEPLAGALEISVIELLNGESIQNRNRSANVLKSRFYVCPVCGNVIRTLGEAIVSCCGVTLPPLEPEDAEEDHELRVEPVEDELYVRVSHPMTREHHITFLAAVSDRELQFVKLYPQEEAAARFRRNGSRYLYAYCSHHGLFRKKL